eukprot:CAMPEP_0181216296 /NCGR_PEP_ID=MMETSP1096-20121128/26502_1 /TAXON_ID=156174 ORGANISM="Chrysochromulina ericina, Strain CCMP281" /NCGR_SAMPLE_ID=MMETSP1096 /ASSEMBLY_ACC=CAM_ASM_000453 /LENGTH=75 /DNA_ID=CAMNT_0023308271 /DNA_START=395 /DNA_END=619 /DNA_ORIENTATION=-
MRSSWSAATSAVWPAALSGDELLPPAISECDALRPRHLDAGLRIYETGLSRRTPIVSPECTSPTSSPATSPATSP